MKNIYTIILFLFSLSLISQQDTIFTKNDSIKFIACKLQRISVSSIFYNDGSDKSIELKNIKYYKLSQDQNYSMKRKSKDTLDIQNLEVKQKRNTKYWLGLSALTLISAGLCNLHSTNMDDPSIRKVKNIQNLSGALITISGACLLVGFTIQFQ